MASGNADLDGDGKMDAELVKEFMDEHDINNKDIFNDDETVGLSNTPGHKISQTQPKSLGHKPVTNWAVSNAITQYMI